MLYLKRSNVKKKSKTRLALTVGGLTILAVFLARFFFPNASANLVGGIASPLWQADNSFGGFLHKSVMLFKSRNAIIEENRLLKDELRVQEENRVYLEVLKNEYANLKAMYGRNELENRILASVLATPPETPYDTIILDAGRHNKIRVGNVVMSSGNVALGKVSEASEKMSKVLLFSSPGEQTKVFIERNALPITIIGRGGGSFEANVPQDTDIVTGDILILPGLSFPVAGRVVEIYADVQSSFKTALISSTTNFGSIRFVEVFNETLLDDE